MSITDKRYYARKDCAIEAGLQWENQLTQAISLINLSEGGAGFEISHAQKMQLLQNDIDLHIGSHASILNPINLNGRVRHLRRLSQDSYVGGIEFNPLSDEQSEQLANLLKKLCHY